MFEFNCFLMKKIVLAGERKSGKSLLTYALSKFYRKNGVDCATANLDPGVKHLKHVPAFDVRKTLSTAVYPELSREEAVEKILRELNYSALDRELNRVKCGVLLVDSAFSLEQVLTSRLELSQYVDCFLLLTSAEKVESKKDELVLKCLGEVASLKQEVPCAVLANKEDLRPAKARKIFDYSFTQGQALEQFSDAPFAYCSALEKSGLNRVVALVDLLAAEK